MFKFKEFILESMAPQGVKSLQEPICFRSHSVQEEVSQKPELNLHIISDKLKHTHEGMTDREKLKINSYTRNSYDLNHKLIHGKELDSHEKDMHDTILKHAKPAKHEVHLYSGTGRDFGKMAGESEDKVLHSPAHISMTHSLKTARAFSMSDKSGNRHLIHLHVKPHDKVLHIGDLSNSPSERETVLPAGTKIKHSHTDEYTSPDNGHKYTVHHFTVHSQE